jgi:hypothetical protein
MTTKTELTIRQCGCDICEAGADPEAALLRLSRTAYALVLVTNRSLVLAGRAEEQVPLLEAQGLAGCPVVADLQAAVDYISEPGE